MNVEKLHAVADAVEEDLRQTAAVETLESLVKSLQDQVTQPQQPDHQTKVANYRSKLVDKLALAPSNSFPPTWNQVLEQFGAADLLGSTLSSQVEEIFARHQITPTVAREELADLLERLSKFRVAIGHIRTGFSSLDIGAEKLESGDAEIGVLIPREFVDNSLDKFGKEL